MAVEELYSRNWKYHKTEKTWISNIEKNKNAYKINYFDIKKWSV